MADDKIRLALEILGAGDAKELATQVRAMKAAFVETTPAATAAEAETYELADAYDVLGDEMQSVFTTAQQIGPGMKATAAATSATTATVIKFGDASIDTAAKVTAAGTRIQNSSRNSGLAILNLSRAVQDGVQGGIGGALNNVEGLLLPFGSQIAAMAGPATLLATAG